MTILTYSIACVSSSLLFMLLCGAILKYTIPAKFVFALLGAAIILRIALIPIHPVGSDDWYRYVWDGKVMNAGINPYRYSPVDPALAHIHSNILPSRINFADMKTLYPPVAEILFYLGYKIGGKSFFGMKALLFVFDLFTMYGIFLIIRKLRLDIKNILLYALCPLPLFQFFIDAHVDGLGITLLVFSIFFYLDDKKVLSYLLIGLSASIKPVGLILIPILFFRENTLRDRLKVVLVPTIVCGLTYVPFIFSGSPFQSLATFAENWTFNGIVFDILNSFIHDNQLVRIICGILFFLSYLPVALSRSNSRQTGENLLAKIYVSMFLLFIFSPVVHPWYISWLVILLPFIPRWSGIAYVSLISLTVFTVLNYQSTGIWKEYVAVLLLEYIPVLAMFGYELVKQIGVPGSNFKRSPLSKGPTA
ncbi:MAG: glycosyltransferase 87 family protein [Candidatus Kryptoniota bacterium]